MDRSLPDMALKRVCPETVRQCLKKRTQALVDRVSPCAPECANNGRTGAPTPSSLIVVGSSSDDGAKSASHDQAESCVVTALAN